MKRTWKARMGKLLRVKNTGRRFGSATSYLCTKIELPDGREQAVLFTPNQIRVARKRALTNREDLLNVPVLRDLID